MGLVVTEVKPIVYVKHILHRTPVVCSQLDYISGILNRSGTLITSNTCYIGLMHYQYINSYQYFRTTNKNQIKKRTKMHDKTQKLMLFSILYIKIFLSSLNRTLNIIKLILCEE